MPVLGEKRYNKHRSYQEYLACVDCNKERWVKIRQNVSGRCNKCSLQSRRKHPVNAPLIEGNTKRPVGSPTVIGHKCLGCGKLRWIQLVKGAPKDSHCKKCNNNTPLKVRDFVPRNKQGDRLILRTCSSCSKQSWVARAPGGNVPRAPRCKPCANRKGQLEYHARGKTRITEILHGGRIYVRLDESSPYYQMVNKGEFVAESRLVMAKHLQRCLTKEEVIHHCNGNTRDNSITNLERTTKSNHTLYHTKERLKARRQ